MLITGRLNTEQSNRGWTAKRGLLNDRSTLLVSAKVRTADHWDESVIKERSYELAGIVIQLWPGPVASIWD